MKLEQKNDVLSSVVRDAAANALYFIVGTVAIVLIGSWSRRFGIVLAGIEAVFAAIQSFKALLAIVGSVGLFSLVLFGKCKRQDDEAEMRWATLIRLIELGIWMGCLFVLYRFFFAHTPPNTGLQATTTALVI
jgi:hypothetical protein